MNIVEQRFLRGPSLYAATPCLLALIDLAARQNAAGLGARLLALLPAMPPEAAARLSDCQAAHEALEPVVMELQRLAGAPGTFAMTKSDPAQPHQARVVCGYTVEQVAGQALRTAAALIDACARHEAFDLDAALDGLRDTAHRHAIGTSTAAVLAAAHKADPALLERHLGVALAA